MSKTFKIVQYPFDSQLESTLLDKQRDYLSWPMVYLLENDKISEAYVGETTDVVSRMKTHLKASRKQKLTSSSLILSDIFNKSATLDIEASLIKYISADGRFTLQNGNLGISHHQYYNQKEVYWDLFKDIWNELRSLGVTRHSLEYIDNSDLFKYSPYKSLSKEQVKSLKLILQCLLDEEAKVSLIQGGAGTGKSILAIFLFKLLKTELSDFNYADFDEDDEEMFELLKAVKARYGDLKMAMVIPMSSFRKTISNVFKNIKGLSAKMVIGPSEIAKQKYDLLIVDEAHRLRRRVNLGSYFGVFDKNCELLGLDKFQATELDWIGLQSNKSILLYDNNQSVKPSDTPRESFDKLINSPSTRVEKLNTQLRVRGGNEYVKTVHQIFDATQHKQLKPLSIKDYEIYLFDDIEALIKRIHKKESSDGLSRLIAGYAWEWKSQKDENVYDIEIDNVKLKWNSITVDWVNSANAINEVGCIHTTQGYDVNYAGIIIGPEIDYDFTTQEIIVYKERYKDKAGKNSISDPAHLLSYITNIYKTILLRAIKGTYIYVCNENLKKFLGQYIPTYAAERNSTPALQIYHEYASDRIPYYDLEIAAGSFSEYQAAEDVRYIESPDGRYSSDYFACRVVGESMNKIIPNGSICLFRKYAGGSRNGLITLVESSSIFDSEFGAQYTIKEYLSKKTQSEFGWQHQEIQLIPKSYDTSYENIILRDEETVDLKVIGEFVKVLSE